ncbi:hypothetical protein [Phytoactinopolyspora halotolerans]|uniref:Uncharacterized protein n=1 Tax=Phytoactinopolyspora halotolerans TaxID=1981512 RepID=A0A6L9SHN2_9ACTN|nr:hypothetical protein [Phytoactinopolyspora halotolerans]NEE03942.1 hypothetical protein [Phytoactinopolyspora halotolerans]
MTWAEADYVEYLQQERRLFAWVMQRHGGLSPDESEAAALEQYPYEPSDAPFRGLVFHDEAWHWAMLAIHGDRYWADHPEFAQASAEYRALG